MGRAKIAFSRFYDDYTTTSICLSLSPLFFLPWHCFVASSLPPVPPPSGRGSQVFCDAFSASLYGSLAERLRLWVRQHLPLGVKRRERERWWWWTFIPPSRRPAMQHLLFLPSSCSLHRRIVFKTDITKELCGEEGAGRGEREATGYSKRIRDLSLPSFFHIVSFLAVLLFLPRYLSALRKEYMNEGGAGGSV